MSAPHSDTTPPGERLTDYERAVCYYTLPRTTSTVTLALILVYALCLFEALGALIYGLVTENQTWTHTGTVCLGAIIVFGVVAFTGRAVLSEVRRRRALNVAHAAPDSESAAELPDPFLDHVLLRRPLLVEGGAFDCTDRDGVVRFRVEIESEHERRVLNADGTLRYCVRVTAPGRSFALEDMFPRRVEILHDEEVTGRVVKRFTLGSPTLDLEDKRATMPNLSVREGGVYRGIRLVGRLYPLRDLLYLDVEERAFTEALLALFVAMDLGKARAILY